MTTIGITGVRGLIGWHLRSLLHGQSGLTVSGADRETFASTKQLDAFVRGCDAIVHLAGMNRGDDREIEATNLALARALIESCERTQRRPHIVFSSSIHAFAETPYGRSKRSCGELFRRWSRGWGTTFTNLILPHVFGEGGRPFYNSVVSTFCYQLARGEEPAITRDSELELLHAQEVSRSVLGVLQHPVDDDVRLSGQPITVSALLANLQNLAQLYRRNIVPDLTNKLDLFLFNTYRSYLFPNHYPVAVDLRSDARGVLFEAMKALSSGQCFLSTTKSGVTRGDHYHTCKFERFLVVGGEGLIRIRKIFDNQIFEFRVAGERPQYVDMPTLHTHNITNVGSSDLVTLFWSNEFFDPERPDTYIETV
jgi:UDP-2-acetamido-2,6-beta-L-arabino-hexul-4-ose reductase